MWVLSKYVNWWKVITKEKIQIVKEQCWISRSSEGQGHDDTCCGKSLHLSNIVCEYVVNPLTNDKVISEIQNFNAKW